MMTNAQNRKRWAISQQKQARVIFAQKRNDELRREAETREWLNMFFGNLVARTLRGDRT
jgi:hypothetical protein